MVESIPTRDLLFACAVMVASIVYAFAKGGIDSVVIVMGLHCSQLALMLIAHRWIERRSRAMWEAHRREWEARRAARMTAREP